MKFQSVALALGLGYTDGFHSPFAVRNPSSSCCTPTARTLPLSPLFASSSHDKDDKRSLTHQPSVLRRVLNRLDTVDAAGLEDVKLAGVFDKIKKLHGPKTYLALSLLAGMRWTWLFRSPYYWVAVAFCVKWYRARYVFKIPVWDRQPNWNNIVTSKEQEKDLKAFTCKTCGSTLFIAKTREFFFEGDTGIGGLGCFSCGAKGRDNFVMDRDRIIEDVGDLDDYFEYERPLDFVSRAERRKLMKEAGGDEEKANEILVARAAAEVEASTTSDDKVNGGSPTSSAEADVEEKQAEDVREEAKEEDSPEPVIEAEIATEPSSVSETEVPAPPAPAKEAAKKSKPKKVAAKKPAPVADEDLDVLDMDDF